MASKIKGTFKDEQGNNFYPHCYQEESGDVQSILNKVYPVGAIYISVNNTNPQTLFGGTWVQIQDSFLLAAGSSYTAGNAGGAATHTHDTKSVSLTVANLPAHTHTGSTNNTGGHTHNMEGWRYTNNGGSYPIRARHTLSEDPVDTDTTMKTAGAHEHTFTTDSTGSGTAHNHGTTESSSNMPPYLVVYMWKRTA